MIQLNSTFNDEMWYIVVNLISAIMGASLYFVVQRYKKLQVHPMRIMMGIWLSVSIF